MYEDVECPICKRIGCNVIDEYPVKGHPNVTEKWLICGDCGHDIKEVKE